MTVPIFPVLSGQGWSVHKKPTFSTLIAPHVSGREVRAALYSNPIWQFEANYDGLDSSPSALYPGLGAQSFQSLVGLFLQCQGRCSPFIYYDPTDFSVVNQLFGVGTGSVTSFQLQRTLGGFTEGLVAPFTPSAPALFNLPGVSSYAPNNLVVWSQSLTASPWSSHCLTISSGVADPFGGANAQTLTATAAGASLVQSTNFVGASLINSVWLRRRVGAGQITLTTPNGAATIVTPSASWVLFSVAGASGASASQFGLGIAVAGDAVDVYAAHQEISTNSLPGAYVQTMQSPYLGGPVICVNGALQDSSTYTMSSGVVTFATPPASGAALSWNGYFGFLCRFDDDAIDFEQFMSNLWRVDSVKFRSVRAQ